MYRTYGYLIVIFLSMSADLVQLLLPANIFFENPVLCGISISWSLKGGQGRPLPEKRMTLVPDNGNAYTVETYKSL